MTRSFAIEKSGSGLGRFRSGRVVKTHSFRYRCSGDNWGSAGSGCLALAVLTLSIFAAGSARAVDIVHRDRTAHEVIVNRSDGSSEAITLGPRQRLENICDDCVVLVGASSVETRGGTTIKIERGEASLETRRQYPET